jgi:hypothetical protein
MSETPLSAATLREIAEELLRRSAGEAIAEPDRARLVSTGKRRGPQRRDEGIE